MPSSTVAAPIARRIRISGVVQGVGFRPYVFRLASAHGLRGWVLNGSDGVSIHVEGSRPAVDAFIDDLSAHLPPAACIARIDVIPAAVIAVAGFEIRHSEPGVRPTTRVAPDLPVCDGCLREMFDPADRRYRYPYINCTDCGPRFSIVRRLPYDRSHTTMADWPMCAACAAEYHDAGNRRFHAQPIACPACGPQYCLTAGSDAPVRGNEATIEAVRRLNAGEIVAVKGIGGYHLACDAGNAAAVAALRARKYRKEQAFAVMVRDISVADRTVVLTPDARSALASPVRPIVLAAARVALTGVAPDNRDLGVMLPYTPLHHLLFALGAPELLVMTSGNRSSEPIAFEDDDARRRLGGLADAFLAGERPIARRVDDSVVRPGRRGPAVLRRSRGLAPGAVVTLPGARPILAVGGDLKNTITLVVDGQAYVSQHIGDLSHRDCRDAFDATVRDFLAMYAVPVHELIVVHDAHPQYASTVFAASVEAQQTIAVQHHRAHVASVLAEHDALDRRVLGLAFDGTGYGDDGTIWGGELFAGSVRKGFARIAHLRPAVLAGGDAAAQHPVQAAAGFLAALDGLPDLMAPPFCFPDRYRQACAVVRSGVRTLPTTSAGRLFDAAAALVGFTRPMTFEGQAAMWLEQLAGTAGDNLQFPLGAEAIEAEAVEIDWRPILAGVADARRNGIPPAVVARAFHRSLAQAVARTILTLTDSEAAEAVVLSGGVIQNELFVRDLRSALAASSVEVWLNRHVPPNDGGLSLGQAALACGLGEA